MRIAVGADHAGFEMKEELVPLLRELGHEPVDLGAHKYDAADDYPDFALLVAQSVARGETERGLLVCGSGIGATVAANKVVGARAAICPDTYSARQGVEHDDLNVLVVGGRTMGIEPVKELVRAFAGAEFSGEERHVRRLNKVLEIERGQRKA
jgi:ribose 5-phosphate isomerase B